MAKASYWVVTDAEIRKLGEQMGLETPVVLAVNAVHSFFGTIVLRNQVNTLSVPPGEYARKCETQRN